MKRTASSKDVDSKAGVNVECCGVPFIYRVCRLSELDSANVLRRLGCSVLCA